MKKITVNDSIYDLVTKHPEIKGILFELGFKEIVKPGMIQTVGKFMNLKKGSVTKKISMRIIIEKLEASGFEIIDDKDLLLDKE